MTDPKRLAAWPKLLAQLDDDQYEALTLAFNALAAGHLTAEELDELATEANLAGMIEDVGSYQPRPIADDLADLAAHMASMATDLKILAARLDEQSKPSSN